jgi:Tfp pilus assembly ATPase PilU
MDFHQLLTECVKRRASDLHLKSGSRPAVRVHGHLETQDDLPAVTRDFMRKTAMTLLGEIRYNALVEGAEMDLAYRQELVTYETARAPATNPDDFDLKVKGIFSTGEMTWDASSPGFVGAPGVGRRPGPAKRN